MTTSSTTSLLRQWLNSIDEARVKGLDGTAHVDVIADANRATVKALLDDPAVQQAIDQARSSECADQAKKLEVFKSILVEACWIYRLVTAHLVPSTQSASSATRTEKLRELKGAARKAESLAKDITALERTPGKAPGLEHLISRFAHGNPSGFISRRKGWGAAIVGRPPSTSELLRMLAADLNEDAEFLMRATSKNRQTGGSLRGIYPLIDALFRHSLQLGKQDANGAPSPDFQLVYTVLKSLMPDGGLDESTLRRRWNRQGKPKPKPP